MIPEQIIITGFLSYKKKQIINFPQMPVCLVNGSINYDPSLSNGSGKSGLFEAIPVNLFGKIGGRAEVLDAYINHDMDNLEIDFIFKIDDSRYKSTFSRRRGASTKSNISYDVKNEGIENSKWKPTDKTIEDILGLSFSTYNSTIYLNERDSLKFIDGGSSDRKEILRELLNAKVFELASKKASDKYLQLDKEILLNSNLMENKQEQIENEEEYKEEIESVTSRNKKRLTDVKKLKKKYDNLVSDARTIELKIEKQKQLEEQIEEEYERKEEYQEQIETKNDKIAEVKKESYDIRSEREQNFAIVEEREDRKRKLEDSMKDADKKSVEKKIKTLQEKVKKKNTILNEKEKVLLKIQIEMRGLRKLLEKVEDFGNLCPITEENCSIVDDKFKEKFKDEKQSKLEVLVDSEKDVKDEIDELGNELDGFTTDNEDLLDKLERINTKLETIREIEIDIGKYEIKNAQFKTNLESLKKSKSELKSEVKDLEKKFKDSENKMKELIEKIEKGLHTKLDEFEDKIGVAKEELEEKEDEVKNNETRIAVLSEKLKEIDDIKKHIKKLIKSNEELTNMKRIFLLLVTIFGKEGIQKAMIKQVIPFLEKSTSELLKIFNNDSEKIKVKFDLDPKRADGEYKKGGGLDLLVIEDGRQPKDLRMYSGGERIRLIFSIILGLARLLSKRSGKKHETLIIDEKIAKLDRRGIDQFAEVIEIISKWYKRIFVITHIESLKDMFNQGEILVNKTEEEGSIVTVNGD